MRKNKYFIIFTNQRRLFDKHIFLRLKLIRTLSYFDLNWVEFLPFYTRHFLHIVEASQILLPKIGVEIKVGFSFGLHSKIQVRFVQIKQNLSYRTNNLQIFHSLLLQLLMFVLILGLIGHQPNEIFAHVWVDIVLQ